MWNHSTLRHVRLQLYRRRKLSWWERMRHRRVHRSEAAAIVTQTAAQQRQEQQLQLRHLAAFQSSGQGYSWERFAGYLDVSVLVMQSDHSIAHPHAKDDHSHKVPTRVASPTPACNVTHAAVPLAT